MNVKPVVPRRDAVRDADEAITYYLERGSLDAALGFIDALERVYGDIGRHPAAGSPRYAHELDLPGLRFWLVPGYPYVVFYIERDDHVDVWRVLHGQRDIPSWMAE